MIGLHSDLHGNCQAETFKADLYEALGDEQCDVYISRRDDDQAIMAVHVDVGWAQVIDLTDHSIVDAVVKRVRLLRRRLDGQHDVTTLMLGVAARVKWNVDGFTTIEIGTGAPRYAMLTIDDDLFKHYTTYTEFVIDNTNVYMAYCEVTDKLSVYIGSEMSDGD